MNDYKTLFDLQNGPESSEIMKAMVLEQMEDLEKTYTPGIKKEVGLLIDWAAEHCFSLGYTPEDIIVVKKAIGYGSQKAVGIKFQAKKNSESWKHLLYFFHKRQEDDVKEIRDLNLLLVQEKAAQVRALQRARNRFFYAGVAVGFLACAAIGLLIL